MSWNLFWESKLGDVFSDEIHVETQLPIATFFILFFHGPYAQCQIVDFVERVDDHQTNPLHDLKSQQLLDDEKLAFDDSQKELIKQLRESYERDWRWTSNEHADRWRIGNFESGRT